MYSDNGEQLQSTVFTGTASLVSRGFLPLHGGQHAAKKPDLDS
jgi:hypothetical protein